MMTKLNLQAKSILASVLAAALVVAVVWVWLGQRANHYREIFSEVRPGMSKTELTALAGPPATVDTTRSGYEVWIFEVPSLFAERPHCFFELGDSVLLRFRWEPVDTTLTDDRPGL